MPAKTDPVNQTSDSHKSNATAKFTTEEQVVSAEQVTSSLQRVQANPRLMSPNDVLRLQKTVGNQATMRLLGQQNARPKQAASSGQAIGGLAPGVQPEDEGATVGGMINRTIGETLGDMGRPIGNALGNAVGAVAGAVTGIDINSTTNTGPTFADHGHFDWRVGFTTTGKSGWLVQKIVNDFRGEDSTGTAIDGSAITPEYYEAWAVDASSAVTPAVGANNDYWIRPGRGAGSKGHWSMTGKVYFTTTDPATQGFTAGGVANAGILLSTTSEPSGLGVARLHRYAQGTWDSTGATPTHTGSAN